MCDCVVPGSAVESMACESADFEARAGSMMNAAVPTCEVAPRGHREGAWLLLWLQLDRSEKTEKTNWQRKGAESHCQGHEW